jgi:uroporphyrinogen decarboxylase
MTSRERFLAALACSPLDRPPVWIMRQAGRYLPEYRALKGKSSFLEMVRTPELASEVTLQPLRRFALDAAIIFSDILVIPEAMGQGYKFRDAGGIEMDFKLETQAQLDRLDPVGVQFRLDYVGKALERVKAELKGEKALLGFGGSPWTLATYMLEGGSADDFGRSKAVFHSDRAFFDALMGKLTAALIEYFQMQIRAGADAIQIFDSWGGISPGRITRPPRSAGSATSSPRCQRTSPLFSTPRAPRPSSLIRPSAAHGRSAWTGPWTSASSASSCRAISPSRATSTRCS